MENKLFSVLNEVVVITGVSGRLGYQYAKEFLEQGAIVVGIDQIIPDFKKEFEAIYGNNFILFEANILVKGELELILLKILDLNYIPSVLINNAAIDSNPSASVNENGPFESYKEDSWDMVIDVNLKGVFLCCQVFGSKMAQVGYGSIINIGSIYGIVSPDQSIYEYRRRNGDDFYKPIAYSVSKSGLLNLTRYLAVYWAKKGVRVNTLTLSGVFSDQETSFLKAYCDRIPIGRMASASDCIGPIFYLASRASIYMTGSNLIVDGGWTAI